MWKREPPECLYWETTPPRKTFGMSETQGKGTHLIGYSVPPPSFTGYCLFVLGQSCAVTLWLTWNLLWRPGWIQNQDKPPTSVSIH